MKAKSLGLKDFLKLESARLRRELDAESDRVNLLQEMWYGVIKSHSTPSSTRDFYLY